MHGVQTQQLAILVVPHVLQHVQGNALVNALDHVLLPVQKRVMLTVMILVRADVIIHVKQIVQVIAVQVVKMVVKQGVQVIAIRTVIQGVIQDVILLAKEQLQVPAVRNALGHVKDIVLAVQDVQILHQVHLAQSVLQHVKVQQLALVETVQEVVVEPVLAIAIRHVGENVILLVMTDAVLNVIMLVKAPAQAAFQNVRADVRIAVVTIATVNPKYN